MTTTTLLNVFQRKDRSSRINSHVFGPRMGLITSLVGCRHENLSRPFGQSTAAYRTCLGCGARKQFNTRTLETSRVAYCPPVIEHA